MSRSAERCFRFSDPISFYLFLSFHSVRTRMDPIRYRAVEDKTKMTEVKVTSLVYMTAFFTPHLMKAVEADELEIRVTD